MLPYQSCRPSVCLQPLNPRWNQSQSSAWWREIAPDECSYKMNIHQAQFRQTEPDKRDSRSGRWLKSPTLGTTNQRCIMYDHLKTRWRTCFAECENARSDPGQFVKTARELSAPAASWMPVAMRAPIIVQSDGWWRSTTPKTAHVAP